MMDAHAAEVVAQAATAEQSNPFAQAVYWLELLNGWGTVGLVILVAVVAWFFYSLNSGATPFRFGDTLIDPMTGKGSILRTTFLLVVLWAISTVSYCVLTKQPPPSEIIGILSLVVAPMIAGRYFETKDPRVVAQAQVMSPPNAEQPPPSTATPPVEQKP